MSEVLRDLVVSLSLDGDNFSRNLTSINRQIKEADSEFKLAASGVNNFEQSVSGTQAQLSSLQQKLTLQQQAVKQYERALEAANKKLENSYTKQTRLTQSLDAAKQKNASLKQQLEAATNQYERFSNELGESDSATIAARENMEALAQEYAESNAEVQRLEGQLSANTRNMQRNADAVTQARTNLNNANAALRQTEQQIQAATERLARMRSAWTQAGESLTAFGTRCTAVSKSMEKIGKTLTVSLTTPIAAMGTAAVKASVEYESAFASVEKTVDATEAEYAELSDAVQQMSTEVASSATDIAEVMANAGQLGIQNDYLVDFTRTMIDLGNSTDIAADEAAKAIAQFANITKMSQADFGRFGSALVDLGNNYATTESAIMDMSTRLAAAGSQVGLSQAQILGFATALSSVGLEAQAGGTAFSKAIIEMQVAVETGSDSLKDFANVSGMTTDAFKELWNSDPAAAIEAFIVGLSKMDEEGVSAIVTLQEMGFTEVRLRDTLMRATNATELFSQAQQTATEAWDENVALSNEAGKRYATTESRLKNLKNTVVMAAQRIGDDLNPTIQSLIDSANGLVEKFMALDENQRMMIIKFAAIAAAAGPAILIFSKIIKSVGTVSTVIGKFATAVGAAGGGWKGLVSVLSSSPAVWFAVAAAVVAGTAALIDYASGAKQAREAMQGMEETAKNWKNTAAETFYGTSEGLSFFDMSDSDFSKETQSAQEWMDGLINIWSDGEKETDEIVSKWTDSFKNLTDSTRTELKTLQENAEQNGYTGVSEQIAADIETLDSMDEEIESLVKNRQNGKLTDNDKIRLQELIDAREAIEIKYKLTEEDTDGFETIGQKVQAEVARAQARGQADADVSVYENAVKAAAEGLASMNSQIDAQYDSEYAVIQLIEDAAERQAALDELNTRYTEQRKEAAQEYAETLASIVMPVWNQPEIQEAGEQVDQLYQKLREYSTATEEEKPAILEEMNQISASMDEGALTEYYGLLTQIQSLLDSGMSEEEVQALFPEIDFSEAMTQLAAIQSFLNDNDGILSGLQSMFGEGLSEEVLTIATDLNMEGAQARWNEFAANPGAITTDAVVSSYSEAENVVKLQPQVEAFISKYTEVAEGASTATLTPQGIIAYVSTYAEATTGADVSGLTPENVTALVSAYAELASGTDISKLTPDEITAYISSYAEENGVDLSGLSPDGLTAFVLAYQEITGGALTTALTPDDVTAMVAKYLEAEGVDVSALSPDQIEGIVSSFAEATGCDKSQLLQNFTAYITRYDDSGAQKPTVSVTIGITGYDLTAYRQFIAENPIEVEGIVKLGEVTDTPTEVLLDPNTKFWQDGVEIPVDAVPQDQLTADTVAVLDADGTMHILITPEVTGSKEAIENAGKTLTEKAVAVSGYGSFTTVDWGFLNDLYGSNVFDRMEWLTSSLDNYAKNVKGTWKDWRLIGSNVEDYNEQIDSEISPEVAANLQTYVAEMVTALQNGEEISEEDLAHLQTIIDFINSLNASGTGEGFVSGIAENLNGAGITTSVETLATDLQTALDTAMEGVDGTQTGEQVAAGIGEGMENADMSGASETTAANTEEDLNTAYQINSPSRRMRPIGTYVAAGIGQGMTEYSFAGDAGTIASALQAALSTSMPASTFASIGRYAMAGLRSGINSGTAGVVSAIRSAARRAVNAAKAELKIKSPSRVFRDEVGVQVMRGIGAGIEKETANQAKIISNAARYLTGEAKNGAVVSTSNDNRHTYNNSVNSTIQVEQLVVRDEQDVHSLAVEIAALTRRQQRGRGMRLA